MGSLDNSQQFTTLALGTCEASYSYMLPVFNFVGQISIFIDVWHLHQLFQPELSQKNPLHESAVIITSRPIASGDLHPVVSLRVEILGFTTKQLKEYFTECLEDDTKAVETLLERIQENPAVTGCCYLPLNASILVHLFKSYT